MCHSALAKTLDKALQTHPVKQLCVAFSGGPDSTALLHGLVQRRCKYGLQLRAIHVDHGIQQQSHAWLKHCQQICKQWQVPLESVVTSVQAHGDGLEAAAREARYQAFAQTLGKGEWLLTAHHRDDQVETILLKLIRGSGPQGLGGMRTLRPFAQGQLWRPLLDIPRAVLTQYTIEYNLPCIEDPSNQSDHFTRNYLRCHILPALTGNYPHVPKGIAQSAQLQQQAADFIHRQAREAFSRLHCPATNTLAAKGWQALHPALRQPVLEIWLHQQTLPVPNSAQIHQLEQQIATARVDRLPQIKEKQTTLCVWRGKIYILHSSSETIPTHPLCWDGQPLPLPGNTYLSLLPGNHPPLKLTVIPGQTHIKFKPAGDAHTRTVKNLFQQAGIPPWQRKQCPFIYGEKGQLLAVGHLWQTQAGYTFFKSKGCWPFWYAGPAP